TGVEMAGAIIELACKTLVRDFRRIDTSAARVILVEAGQRILPAFSEDLSAFAAASLRKKGVEILCGNPVTNIDAMTVTIGEEAVPARTVVWAAGVKASPAGKWLGVEGDRAGRVAVTPHLALPDDERIFVIGDTAAVEWTEG